jgi:YjbE family integral membrane protein
MPRPAEAKAVSFLTDPEFWARWVGIVLINLALSGDNAVVIALAVRTLPPRQALIGRIWGTVGAVLLRLAFVAIVTVLLQVPLLQIIGGFLLIWIAIKLVTPGSEGDEGRVRQGASPWEAVWIIIVADVVMSFDNVIAIAGAAHGNMTLVAFGIGLSIPLVIIGSGILATLMNRFEWIVWIGGGILGYVGGEMIAKDAMAVRVLGSAAEVVQHALAIGLAVVITGLAWWLSRRRRASYGEDQG